MKTRFVLPVILALALPASGSEILPREEAPRAAQAEAGLDAVESAELLRSDPDQRGGRDFSEKETRTAKALVLIVGIFVAVLLVLP